MKALNRLVLVIEDDEVDRERVIRWLGHHFAVCQAATAAVGVEMLKTVEPACVLLDYQLADTNGLDLLTQFQSHSAEVIFLTGQGDERVAAEAMKRGAFDYLVKDIVTQEELQEAVEKAVRLAGTSVKLARAEREVGALLLAAETELAPALREGLELCHQGIESEPTSPAKQSLQEGVRKFDLAASYFHRLLAYGSCVDPSAFRKVDLKELAHQAVQTVALPGGVQAEVSNLPIVNGEGKALTRMFQLLVQQSIRHAGPSLSHIQVDSYHEHSSWVVFVEDNGAGNFPAIPTRLPKLDSGGEWDLLMASRIAQEHGGSITVHSLPGIGSKLVVRLPDQPAGARALTAQNLV